ncbi:hypothetical protein EP47_12670 [Legionella norrlandica]|uniref:SidC N-terminal domain-containing protein n=1 Tax=Legionella norrlandica TaxID=1498499 RepID=A0A0A2SMC3_9GAMM|nr:hypothetical protein [Legionella norrlandica]KGP62300.1 hypothetical protein EP47_12670 [Legionella norrlandica]
MIILLVEPRSSRYIHINQETNKIHLMVPIVGGQEISTDNTCKATVELKGFFDGEALNTLNAYKNALEIDILLLEDGNPQRVMKQDRLAQIEIYIEAVKAMQYSYGKEVGKLLARPSNLYSIQLRPFEQDIQSTVINPTFNIERGNDDEGNPLSQLYNIMYRMFPNITVAINAPRTILTNVVLHALPKSPTFEDIQRVLGEQSLALFGLSIDFTKRTDTTLITKESIDTLMGFEDDATPQDYIDALLGACALDVWGSIPTPPFYSIPTATPVDERTERLSILTQFFLANLNVYCKAKGMSTQNFGVILDKDRALSQGLVDVVSQGLSAGNDVERAICNFFNANAELFELSSPLNSEDINTIKQKFARAYQTITATKENPHMDDFMILDMDATREFAKFATHQGCICVNFAEIVDPAVPNQNYFAGIRTDFAKHTAEIPHKNEWIASEIDIEPEILINRINNDQFVLLPESVKEDCYRIYPMFQIRQWLHDVAKGKQDEAEARLTASPANTQVFLRTPGVFTDYSGRTFHCTAYEYAYWAKDTHMCRMLERYMDEETKSQMLAHIDEMEHVDAAGKKIGLEYQQHGETHHSAHFELTPLIEALQYYINNHSNWLDTYDYDVIDNAWLAIGKAQRDVPAHVAQEYCRPGSFDPGSAFNEETLIRILTFYNSKTHREESWFPLESSDYGLGFQFILIRQRWEMTNGQGPGFLGGLAVLSGLPTDLASLIRLDQIRTSELSQLREHLIPPASNLASMGI